MFDLNVETLLLIVASASVQQRHQAIERLREHLPDRWVRQLCWWLSVNRCSDAAPWQQRAGLQEDEAVLERTLRAFPGYRERRAARILQCAGARGTYQRVAQIMCGQCCLWQGGRESAARFAPRVPSLS